MLKSFIKNGLQVMACVVAILLVNGLLNYIIDVILNCEILAWAVIASGFYFISKILIKAI